MVEEAEDVLTLYQTIALGVQICTFLGVGGIFVWTFKMGVWKGGIDQWKVAVDGRLKRNDEDHNTFEKQFRVIKT